MKEVFYLMNQDTIVLEFTHERTLIGDVYDVVNVYATEQLPIQFRHKQTHAQILTWIEKRTVPVNRHHMEIMLGAVNLKEPFDILRYSRALGLNDTFWIKEKDDAVKWEDVNLYDNPFDEALGWIAFTGIPSDVSKTLGTPEFTTSGVLPKYWERKTPKIQMVKGGTKGYSNAGYEPYREIVACIAANLMDINCIKYHPELRKGNIASVSTLFTNKKHGLITGSEYLLFKYPETSSDFRMLLSALQEDNFDARPLYEMCLLDFIICNSDRHRSNWGFLVDNKTQKIVSFAPVWDNGAALDYGRPKDWGFDFASFNIKYDFVKECQWRADFVKKANKLLTHINTGKLLDDIIISTGNYYNDNELHANTINLIRQQCQEYLQHSF